MRSLRAVVLTYAFLVTLPGCPARTGLPDLPAADVQRLKNEFVERRIDLLIRDRMRLLEIEHAIAVSSARRCGDFVRPHAGVLLSEPDMFDDPALRENVARRFASDRGVFVAGVVEGGSLQRAGIQTGDLLVRAGRKRIRSADSLYKLMLEDRDHGSIEVEFQRNGEATKVDVSLDAGCPIRLALREGHELVTYQPTRLLVAVPLGLLRETEDDLLGAVIAHEVAHALFDVDQEAATEREERADREGLLLAVNAGFDVSALPAYWERVALEYPVLIELNSPDVSNRSGARHGKLVYGRWFSHTDIGRRLPRIRQLIQRLEPPQ